MSNLEVEKNERLLRVLTNFWTFLALSLYIVDFFSRGKQGTLSSAVGIIYILVLGFYTGTKEFSRWQEYHDGRHIGEFFVAIWTTVMIVLIALAAINSTYHISGELVAIYTTVVGIFALTQHSKALYKEAHEKKHKG